MKTTANKRNAATTPGFACVITMRTELGNAVLSYEGGRPYCLASTVEEAREIVSDGARRGLNLPLPLTLWARGIQGFVAVAKFDDCGVITWMIGAPVDDAPRCTCTAIGFHSSNCPLVRF
jgi:hypothetical protein